MKNTFLQLTIDSKKTVLTSKSLFYKTERFIKQTSNIASIDFLLSKFCESIILNLKDIISNEKENVSNECFWIQTSDKNYTCHFKFGYQISNNLNKYDIVFVDYIESANKTHSLKVDEYIRTNSKIHVVLRKIKSSYTNYDFNKLYNISTISGINLPKLNFEQKEIVETIDKNILVQGVAGSGKTNICIDKIIFTACKNYSGKTLYTTFSRGLLIDTKLKIEYFKKDLENILEYFKSKNIVFLDDNHKKALENRLGIYFFSDDDVKIIDKIENILEYLSNKVDYLLIEDIYKNKCDKNARFVDENYFINSYSNNPSNHQIEKTFKKLSHISKEVVYKEIYGMIFGFFNARNFDQMLTLEDYIQKRQNSFSRIESECIYQIALDYKKHCEINNLMDNNSASKKIIKHLKDFDYSLAILDEVQDYTQVNLSMFKKISLKLFCVGDALQMINPSYFSFGYLKNLMYEKDLIDVKELKSNYRNTAKISDIIDSLSEINKAEFGTHSFVIRGQSVDSGLQTTAVYVCEHDFARAISISGFEDVTFVVANDIQKKELRKVIKNQEVLTVSEIKGLERNTIITYNLLSSNIDKWNLLKFNKLNHKLADENSVYRYYYNLFYVGLSRAKQNIFVFESMQVPQFESFFKNNFEKKTTKDSILILNSILKKSEFPQQELKKRVDEFIKLGQYDNARHSANRLKDETLRIDSLRTIDIHEKFIREGKYRDAGIRFWEFGMISEAKEQFILSGDTILIELVDMCSKGADKDLNIGIVEYFEDVKDNKIAQNFILETIRKDINSLKSSFGKIKDDFKKGRK